MLSTNEDTIPRPCVILMQQRLIISATPEGEEKNSTELWPNSAFAPLLEILQNKPMLTVEHQTFSQRLLPTYKEKCTAINIATYANATD
jgi:hypothetical protein